MNIYTIEHENFQYDSYMGHVIVANSETEVREIAKKEARNEGEEVWETTKVEECGKYTCDRIEPFILLSDFQAG